MDPLNKWVRRSNEREGAVQVEEHKVAKTELDQKQKSDVWVFREARAAHRLCRKQRGALRVLESQEF